MCLTTTANSANDMPRYDEGNFIKGQIEAATSAGKRRVFQDCIWTGVPLGVATQSLLATELSIKLRVGRPYETNYNASESAAAPINDNNPVYRFNTAEIFARKQNPDAAVSALDLINVVPNPYYAYSGYETGQLDNRVKITNLPQDCKITIYTANGTLVRVFDKGDPKTSLDWDLKNQSGITISSGIYIIHVNVPGVGEKVINGSAFFVLSILILSDAKQV
jgi:hypothetical protein